MEVLENIVSKIVFFIVILIAVGVFLFVWGALYEEMGSITISSVIRHEGLTVLYIFEQSPYGLLLGWIPAYFASIIFLILFVAILERLLPMIVVFSPMLIVMFLWMWS